MNGMDKKGNKKEKKEKNFFEVLQEMPFSRDRIGQSFVKKIEDDKWDHYSGLPNPKWYEDE